MTFSTGANPRIGQSPAALTSLGAVGGPRGVGAAGLRILVEFLTVYNKEAADAVAGDLAKLEHAAQVSAAAEQKRLQRLSQVRRQAAQADALIRGRLNTAQRRELKTVEALSVLTSKSEKERASTARNALNATLASIGLSDREIGLVNKRLGLRKEEEILTKRQADAEERATQRQRATNQVLAERDRIARQRSGIGGRLGGLAIGAIGGVVGGALLGVGFSAVQGVLDAVGEKLQDILDPARHAREAILEVGGAIAKLAEQDQLTLRAATVKYLNDLGLAADAATVDLLENAAAQKLVADAIAFRKQIADIAAHGDAQELENRKQLTDVLVAEARARGDVVTVVNAKGTSVLINGVRVETLVTQELNRILAENARVSREAAAAQIALANATAFAAIQQRIASDAISGAFQSQIAGLGTGESAKTKRLEARIEGLSSGGGGQSSNRDQLRRIAQERELILLRQRLRLLGTNINLERYSGKFLLEAINAKIAALQKEGDEQSRLNALLDLQFRQSQVIRRQEGESITEFLERRAQEQRHQLQEAANLERDAKIASLEEQRSRVEDEVALAELAEQRKQAARQTGTSNLLSELQKQLAASRKADQEALDAKVKGLQDQAKAVLFYTDKTNQLQIRQAAAAAKTIQDIYALSGELQGLRSAQAFLQALLASGVLSPSQAAAISATLRDLASTIKFVNNQFNQIRYGTTTASFLDKANNQGFAEGGVLELSNARSPFGQNVRLGEQGSEIGVVLSNKVAQILRDKYGGGNAAQFGDVNIYGDNGDWRYQMYQFRQAVKEVLREEFR